MHTVTNSCSICRVRVAFFDAVGLSCCFHSCNGMLYSTWYNSNVIANTITQNSNKHHDPPNLPYVFTQMLFAVFSLCCGKLINFTIKSTIHKKTLDYKSKHTVEMPRKCVAMPTTDPVQLIVNQRQRQWETAATLVFVCTGHWNF